MGHKKITIEMDSSSSSDTPNATQRTKTPMPSPRSGEAAASSPIADNRNSFVNNINIQETEKTEINCCESFCTWFKSLF